MSFSNVLNLIFQSKIESEFWALYKKNMSLLEQMLENQVPQQEKPAKLKPKSAGKVAPSIDYQIEPSRSVSSPLEIDYSEVFWKFKQCFFTSFYVFHIYKKQKQRFDISYLGHSIVRTFIDREGSVSYVVVILVNRNTSPYHVISCPLNVLSMKCHVYGISCH